jgi:hypothetical protein
MEKEIRRPFQHENAAFYTKYIDKVEGGDAIKVMKDNLVTTPRFLQNLNMETWHHRYAPEKWNVKEVMIHVIDTERIFAYRALRIARMDQTPMAGFDQDAYVACSGAESRSPQSILEEYVAVRMATIVLYQNFTDEMMVRMGTASDNPFSTLALSFIIAGHENHHLQILHERYLVS